jgi:cell division septal protein FtsQ
VGVTRGPQGGKDVDAVALTGPRGRERRAPWTACLLPSGRSLAAGFALLLAGLGAYFVARETSIFAIQRIQVEGARPATAAQVEHALAPLLGRSLVGFDIAQARQRLSAIPAVSRATIDRAFPHTLQVHVRLERAVAVARHGADAWLVSSTARVLRRLTRPYPPLPRIWLARSVDVSENSTLDGEAAGAVAAVGPLAEIRFPAAVRSVVIRDGELVLVLARGTEVRLGSTGDLRLKLAIAARILPLVAAGKYIDVSVPERPVASPDSQVLTRG